MRDDWFPLLTALLMATIHRGFMTVPSHDVWIDQIARGIRGAPHTGCPHQESIGTPVRTTAKPVRARRIDARLRVLW
jgi:hypothetical protein